MIADFKAMPEGSVVLLEQWSKISKVVKERKFIPFFDCAYQGFASGNSPQDAFAIRKFIDDGHLLATVHSFSKNSGLYGQRVGALSIVCQDPNEAKKVLSQTKMTIRPMYSNPPRHGAQLVETILEDDRLTADFIDQCSVMADRINAMRVKLRSTLDLGGGWWKWWENLGSHYGPDWYVCIQWLGQV